MLSDFFEKKPENLFLMKNGDLKIGDFGLALNYSVQEDQVRQLIGSAAFLAPEMCSSLITEFEIPGIDLWSAGITLWMFLFGFCPFMGSDVPSTYEKILNDP
jgi:serine/threonine protein kinase